MGAEATRTEQRELKGGSLSAGIAPVPSASRNGTETSPMAVNRGGSSWPARRPKGPRQRQFPWLGMDRSEPPCPPFWRQPQSFLQGFRRPLWPSQQRFPILLECLSFRYLQLQSRSYFILFSCFGSYLPFGNHCLSRCASWFGGRGVAVVAKSAKLVGSRDLLRWSRLEIVELGLQTRPSESKAPARASVGAAESVASRATPFPDRRNKTETRHLFWRPFQQGSHPGPAQGERQGPPDHQGEPGRRNPSQTPKVAVMLEQSATG